MLNEKRIKLMTKMAAFEEHEGKKMIPIGNYFKHDYVSYQVLKAIISASIAFGLILVVYIYYDLESFLQNICSEYPPKVSISQSPHYNSSKGGMQGCKI